MAVRSEPAARRIRVRSSDRPDPWIYALAVLLVALGSMFVFDTSFFVSQRYYSDGYRMITKHTISIVLGLTFMYFLSRCRSDLLERWGVRFLLLASPLLLLPFVPGIGSCTNGACRWISFGPINLQPAEVAKCAFVIYLAAVLAEKGAKLKKWRTGMAPTLAVMAMLQAVLLMQPDFGNAVLIGVIGVTMMFLAGVPLRQLALLGVPAVAGGALLIALEPYRLRRFLCFLDPAGDPSGACYQLVQSARTFGSGRLWGNGIGASVQKTGYLPEAHTDFIFSVVGEEIGLVGAFVVLACFAALAYRGFRVAYRHPDRFGQMLAAGVTLALALQVMINMGVVLGLLPTKGLALPLVSYGGSSMMVSLASIGILLSLSRELRER